MTFKTSYAKLLSDPTFGQINHRERHAREMYLAGMRDAADVSMKNCESYWPCNECINEAIAEESK